MPGWTQTQRMLTDWPQKQMTDDSWKELDIWYHRSHGRLILLCSDLVCAGYQPAKYMLEQSMRDCWISCTLCVYKDLVSN